MKRFLVKNGKHAKEEWLKRQERVRDRGGVLHSAGDVALSAGLINSVEVRRGPMIEDRCGHSGGFMLGYTVP